jgi:hypothetical protein
MPPVATGLKPNYDLTITDGVNTVGFLTLGGRPDRVRRLPRGVGVERKTARQDDWTGGRGQEVFKDPSRFYDSSAAWTLSTGRVLNGPMVQYARMPRSFYGFWPGDANSNNDYIKSMIWVSLAGRALANAFVAVNPALNARRIVFVIRRVGTGGGNLRVCLRSSLGGSGTILQSVTITASDVDDYTARIKEFQLNSTQTLTNGTTYYVSIEDVSLTGTTADHWEVLVSQPALDGDSYSESTDLSNWSLLSTEGRLIFRVFQDARANAIRPLFFQYKGALYYVGPSLIASGYNIIMNGERGVATGGSQTTTTLGDSTKAWTTNQWAGCVLKIVGGTNKGQARRIVSNTSTVITTLSGDPFEASPTTGANGTEYVILGADYWQTLSGVGNWGSDFPTDVAVINGIVYFARGDGVNMQRYREYNNAGVWTVDAKVDDGSNRATFLQVVQDGLKTYLYRARQDTSAVSRAEQQAWGTALTFETEIPVGTTDSLITGIVWHDDKLYVAKEDDLFAVRSGQPSVIPNPISNGRDLANGKNIAAWNTNLYFPFADGLERFYGQIGDDIGPNRDSGLPQKRQGSIAQFLPVFNYGFAALDGGAGRDRYSALLATLYPGGAWHELFRAPEPNEQIKTVAYQAIPESPSRLFWVCGQDVMFAWLPRGALNPTRESEMRYWVEGYLTTSWFDVGSIDLDHLFSELRLFLRNTSTSRVVEVDYQVNYGDDGIYGSIAAYTWTRMGSTSGLGTEPVLPIGAGTVRGRQIRFRLRLLTDDYETPIIIEHFELRANEMNEVKYDYVIDVRGGNRLQLLHGDEARATGEQAAAVLSVLEGWQENATRLTLTTRHPLMQTIYGHIDPVAIVLDKWTGDDASFSGSITFKEA